jgi:uncharacterized membrane protein (DUF373 family)
MRIFPNAAPLPPRDAKGLVVARGDTMEPTPEPPSEKAVRIVKGFEQIIAFALIVLLILVVTLATVELGWLLVSDLRLASQTLLDAEHMSELFGAFLLVLVGMELLTTLKAYVHHGAVQMEVVLEVALIALAQKVIVLNPRTNELGQFGLATLILALAGALAWARTNRRGDGAAKSID